MKLISQLVPNAEDLLALEPAELGGVLLEMLLSYPPTHQLNRYNFSIEPDAVRGYDPRFHTPIREALMDGWAWLEREGLIVPRVGVQGEWVSLSRRGKNLRDRAGVQAYYKANLLPKELLHPLIESKVYTVFLRGDYDTAVFQAFKEVEVAVRSRGLHRLRYRRPANAKGFRSCRRTSDGQECCSRRARIPCSPFRWSDWIVQEPAEPPSFGNQRPRRGY